MEDPLAECWLHSGVEVGPSPIAGLGLFARVPIRAGTAVSRLGGRLVTWQRLRELFAAAARDPRRPYIDTIAVTEDVNLVLPPGSPNGYGNHGCDPNLWWVDAYTLVARRRIERGEELTNDYATSTASPDFRMACRCGSVLCRGTITGDDWRLPQLREMYGNHWVPALVARIHESA
ncbi:hypothetical protein GCM10023322_80840 [Rugosimonospora acidiphila]|uniref:SET domain-containing protein-lysine N-methyltransferase n=1 Tax=Rugosimonospora acidiphila TaxID=556531 RepID=A0ABP9SR92_9ACTN